ncbi:MAG: RtcB family protein [Thiothrix sp.]|nr:MAG: RtcB family protein [Thiothrix sp.]
MSVPSLPRLKKAFNKLGIHLERSGDIVRVINAQAEATILLPASLPLEQKAVTQLLNFASVHDPLSHQQVCKACATPDFHPGSIAPVGTIVATPSDFVIPAAIGTDINCGMRLLTLGFSLQQAEQQREPLIQALTRALLQNGRNIPVHTHAFETLLTQSPQAFLEDQALTEGLWQAVDRQRLERELAACIGLGQLPTAQTKHLPEAYLAKTNSLYRDPCLGTIGSGNHFVELQQVAEIVDNKAAYQAGIKHGQLVAMIHSGSRDLGFYVGKRWMDKAKTAWPQGLKHPQHELYGLTGALASEYIQAMSAAARYAWLNRVVLAEMLREQLNELGLLGQSELVVDVPHNVVLQEQGLNIHRKGATPAHAEQLALIPGSMGDYSYLVSGLGNPDWLFSCSHGAGRSVRRQAMRATKTPSTDHNWHCVTLKEERRIEEAPSAYKPIGAVIESQQQAGLIKVIAKFKPWITFKA